MIDESILKKVFKPRKRESHKYDFGHLLVIGGSKRYSGSPAFASLAAYRTGVDIVTTAAPERSANIIATFSPSLITYPLKGNFIERAHLDILLKLADKATAVVIGGGIERNNKTLNTVAKFLKNVKRPCVVDADAIYAVAKHKKIVKNKPFVITPHAFEFMILTGNEVSEKRVKKAASDLGTVILAKGATDIISDGEKLELNTTGNPYMTVGGTGDTLAGICGALLAQGAKPFEAACGAAYINGKAGDLARKEKRKDLMADDLLEMIGRVI